MQQQIADHYAALIDSGEIREGDRLPGRSEIVARWQVSRIVAQSALKILCDTRRAATIPKRGTYAIRPSAAIPDGC